MPMSPYVKAKHPHVKAKHPHVKAKHPHVKAKHPHVKAKQPHIERCKQGNDWAVRLDCSSAPAHLQSWTDPRP